MSNRDYREIISLRHPSNRVHHAPYAHGFGIALLIFWIFLLGGIVSSLLQICTVYLPFLLFEPLGLVIFSGIVGILTVGAIFSIYEIVYNVTRYFITLINKFTVGSTTEKNPYFLDDRDYNCNYSGDPGPGCAIALLSAAALILIPLSIFAVYQIGIILAQVSLTYSIICLATLLPIGAFIFALTVIYGEIAAAALDNLINNSPKIYVNIPRVYGTYASVSNQQSMDNQQSPETGVKIVLHYSTAPINTIHEKTNENQNNGTQEILNISSYSVTSTENTRLITSTPAKEPNTFFKDVEKPEYAKSSMNIQ